MPRYEPSRTRQHLRDAGINLDLVTEDHNIWTLSIRDGGKISWSESAYEEEGLPPDGWDLICRDASGEISWEDWIEDDELAGFLARHYPEAIR